MANFIVQNCINPSETYVVAEQKETFNIGGVILVAGNGFDLGCFSIIEQTDLQPTAFEGSQVFPDCIECFGVFNPSFSFTECEFPENIYKINSTNFLTLPTINKVYQMLIDEDVEPKCYEFTEQNFNNPGSSTFSGIPEEFNTCEECSPSPFDLALEERNNNAVFQQKQQLLRDNYNEYINNRTINVPK